MLGQTFHRTYANQYLSDLLGSASAYIGFTGSSSTVNQTISNFTFVSGVNIAGPAIYLTAGGSIGAASAPILVDVTSAAQAAFNASAQGGVYVKQTAGTLSLKEVHSAHGDVMLTAAGAGTGIHLDEKARVSAPNGRVTFDRIGNATFASGSMVIAQSAVTIRSESSAQFTLAGTLNAPLVSVSGGKGDDTLTLYQAGLNADLTFAGKDGRNQLILHGLDAANAIDVNGSSILLGGSHALTMSAVQDLQIHGGRGDTNIHVVHTLTTMRTALFGGSGSNHILIGADATTNEGSLDAIQGAIQVHGAGWTELAIDDRGARDANGNPLTAGYIVMATQVMHNAAAGLAPRPGFAGISYDGTTQVLHLLGSRGPNSIFIVKPSEDTEYNLEGNTPAGQSASASLKLDVTGTASAQQSGTTNAGTWSFASKHHLVRYSGMNSVTTLTLQITAVSAPITSGSRTDATVTVTFVGFTSAETARLSADARTIAVQGPRGFVGSAHLRSLQPSFDGSTTIGTYLLAAPDGLWNPLWNGSYTFMLSTPALTDSAGHFVATASLGTLLVNITSPSHLPIQVQIVPGTATIAVVNPSAGQSLYQLTPYPGFGGEVRTAVGTNSGGGLVVVTGPGPGGGPDIRVWDGNTGMLVRQFFAFDPAFTGGVVVAAADVNGDGQSDYIIGAGAGGGPNVTVYSGADGSVLFSAFAFNPQFTGGVRLAVGDIDGDGCPDIVVGAGRGGGPDVRVIDGRTGLGVRSFFAFDSDFTGGVYVAVGDVNSDGKADIAVGAGPGGGPNVRIYDGPTGRLLTNFFAYDPAIDAGVLVALCDLDESGHNVLVTGRAPARADLHAFAPLTAQNVDQMFATNPRFNNSVFEGSSN